MTGNWTVAFSDEFNAPLDTAKWNIANNSTYGSGNNELQCYMSSNVSVSNGVLDIVGQPGTGGCTGKSYTSGWIATGTKATGGTEKFSFTQGYVEMRATAPTGNVFWPALWLQGASSAPPWPAYGEFDITELYPACPNMTTGTLHYDSNGHIQTSPDVYNMATSTANSKGTCNSGTGVINADYHIYGFNWTATKLEWYVDGKKMFWFSKTRAFPVPASDFFNYAHTISINMAMGGTGPAYYGWSPTNTLGNTTDHYLVDYIRVYKPL
jgi:beta-glucanase (GH16 family)